MFTHTTNDSLNKINIPPAAILNYARKKIKIKLLPAPIFESCQKKNKYNVPPAPIIPYVN